ncbi:MAG: peptidase S14, partial [Oscillospiraceae bacterium]|nr:peptidase S14 [Oscillospiraceae bacterium]
MQNDYVNNDNADEDNEKVNEQPCDSNDVGIVAMQNAPHNIHCLTIIGQVEGHFILPPQNKTTKYEHI